MRKLFVALIFAFLIVLTGVTSNSVRLEANALTVQTFDFSEGIPEGWSVQNESDVEVVDGKTRIYVDGNDYEDRIKLENDINFEKGYYELNIHGLYASDSYGDAHDLDTVKYLDNGDETISDARVGETYDKYIGLMSHPDNDIDKIGIEYRGGQELPYQGATDYVSDYIELEKVVIKKIINVSYHDTITNIDADMTPRAIDDPLEMTSENLENASIYLADYESDDSIFTGGWFKGVSYGTAQSGFTYQHNDPIYDLEWTDESGNLYFSYDTYYDAEQGEVLADGLDSYPYKASIFFHDESLNEEEEYDYPLSEYYYFKYVVDTDNMDPFNFESVQPEIGNVDYFTDDKLRYAHILVDDTLVVNGGVPTENEINDSGDVLDAYENSKNDSSSDPYKSAYRIYDNSLSISSPPEINLIYEEGSSYEKGDLGYYNIDFDDGQSESVVEIYLPYEGSNIPVEGGGGIDDPSEENPNAPEGLQSLLSSFGFWNNAGIFLLFAFFIILVNTFLVYKNIRGMAIVVSDLLIYGLFAFMGLLSLVHHMIIIGVFLFAFIMIMKGGGGINE